MSARLSISSLVNLAKSRGGNLLSTEHVSAHAPIQWECGVGHTWWAPSKNVKTRKSWCPTCYDDRRGKARRLEISELRALAISRGGVLLSTEYVNKDALLFWECACGFQWRASAGSVRNSGTWCPRCGYKRVSQALRGDISELQRLAVFRSGRLVSTEYRDCNTPLAWECKNGHRWESAAINVKNCGSWCPKCSGVARLEIDDLRAVAESRGGRLASKEYVNAVTPLTWECEKGHRWSARAYNVATSGQWCPQCAAGKGERMTRACFERIYGEAFPVVRPMFLKTVRGAGQHLDGFCETLSLAFEYDGDQHFELIPRYYMTQMDLDATQARDRRKDALCKANGVTLVRIREVHILTEKKVLAAVMQAIQASPRATAVMQNCALERDQVMR